MNYNKITMKRLWTIALMAAALTLFACGGNNKVEIDGTNEPVAQDAPEATEETSFSVERPADSPVAYEVLQLMLQNGLDGTDKAMADFLEGRKSYQGANELEFAPQRPDGNVTYYQYTDDYEDDWTVKCYPIKGGGWFVLTEVFYIVGDWGPCQYFAYRYVDGQLTPANEIIPNPKFNDIYSDPVLLEGLSEGRIAWLKEVMDGEDDGSGVVNLENYNYYLGMYDAPFVVVLGSQTMAMSDAYFDNNEFQFVKTAYFWNGDQFEKAGPVEYFAYGDETEGDEVVWNWDGEKMAPTYTYQEE